MFVVLSVLLTVLGYLIGLALIPWIILFLPLMFLGRWLFGLPGMFAASTVSNLVLGLVAYLWIGKQISLARSSEATD